MYKIFYYTIFCLQIHFYVLYLSLFKVFLIKIFFSSKFRLYLDFWPEPVDRPVGRPCVRSSRSTDQVDRGSGRCTYPCARFHGRPSGRPMYAWLTDLCSLYF